MADNDGRKWKNMYLVLRHGEVIWRTSLLTHKSTMEISPCVIENLMV